MGSFSATTLVGVGFSSALCKQFFRVNFGLNEPHLLLSGIIATALDPIADEYDLNNFTKGVVTSSVLLGAMLGSILGGYLCDKFGRKKVFPYNTTSLLYRCYLFVNSLNCFS